MSPFRPGGVNRRCVSRLQTDLTCPARFVVPRCELAFRVWQGHGRAGINFVCENQTQAGERFAEGQKGRPVEVGRIRLERPAPAVGKPLVDQSRRPGLLILP